MDFIANTLHRPVVVAEATAVDEVLALLRVGIVSPVRVVALARALHLGGHDDNYEENEGKTRGRAAKFTEVMMTWKGDFPLINLKERKLA